MNDPIRNARPTGWERFWPLLLVPVAALYAPVLGYPFVELDDMYGVVLNPGIRDLSWEGVRYLFLEDRWDFRWFPMSYLSLAVDLQLFGLDARGFHATNLLLHLANTALVFLLARRISRDPAVAAIAGLLFGLHPLQVESVAWVISRKNVLFLFFALLSTHAYLRASGQEGGARWTSFGASMLFFFLAVASKTTAAVFPALFVLLDWHRDRRRPAELLTFLRARSPDKLAYLPFIALAYGMTRVLSERSPYSTTYAFDALDWLTLVAHNLAFYVVKLFAPVGLVAFYPLPDDSAARLPASFYLHAALGIGVVAACVVSWFRSPRVFLGLAWYLVAILPGAIVSVFFSDIPLMAADRYFYAASIGPCLLAGWGMTWLWRRSRSSSQAAAVVAAGLLVLLALSGVSAKQVRVWRGTVPLFEHLVAHQPSDAFYYKLAFVYHGRGESEKAFAALDAAESASHQIFFDRLLIHQLRISDLYRRKGEFSKAIRFATAAIEATPNSIEPGNARTPVSHLYLAHLFDRAGRPEQASQERRASANASPDPHALFESLWFALAPDLAERVLRDQLARSPGDGVAWHYLGRLQQSRGFHESSADSFRRAEELGFSP